MHATQKPPSTRHRRIVELDDEVRGSIDTRLQRGDSAKEVADFLKDELNLFPNTKVSTLSRQLDRYRSDFLDANLVAAVQRAEGNINIARRSLQRMEDFDAMDQLMQVADLQRRRVNKLLLREEELPVLLPEMKNEIRLLMDANKTFLTFALDIGLIRRAPIELTAGMTLLGGDSPYAYSLEAQLEGTKEMTSVLRKVIKNWGEIVDGEYTDVSE